MDVQVVDNFIAGRWVPAHASEFFDVHNPAVGDVIGRTPLSTGADVDAAVQAATLAFPAWRETPVNTRAQVLYKFKARLEQHFESLVRTQQPEEQHHPPLPPAQLHGKRSLSLLPGQMLERAVVDHVNLRGVDR